MQMDVDVANQLMEPGKTEGKDDKANEETEEEDGPQGWLLGRIWRTYNRPMVVVLGLQYFMQWLTFSMGTLALLDIYGNKLKMDLAEVQYSFAVLATPWIPKIIYGIF